MTYHEEIPFTSRHLKTYTGTYTGGIMFTSSVRRNQNARLERNRRQKISQEIPVGKNTTEITSKEERERLRGCYDCPLKVRHTIRFDNGETMQPRVTTRVQCEMLGNQVVRPTTAAHHKDCPRLIHVANKKASPEYITRHSNKSGA